MALSAQPSRGGIWQPLSLIGMQAGPAVSAVLLYWLPGWLCWRSLQRPASAGLVLAAACGTCDRSAVVPTAEEQSVWVHAP